MSDALQIPPRHRPPVGTRPLWAAIAVLGIAVVAMGSSMLMTQHRDAAGSTESRLANGLAASGDAAALRPPSTGPASAEAPAEIPPTVLPSAPTRPPAVRAPVAARSVAPVRAPAQLPAAPGVYGSAPDAAAAGRPGVYGTTPAPAPAGQPAVYGSSQTSGSAPGAYSSAPVPCLDCGTVLAVLPVQRAVPTNGTGAVAGGVLGAVVGNQIGHGSGRAVATVLGAVGGGWAGNHVEKNMRQRTAYVVKVRMEDGSLRSVEQSRSVEVGSPVVLRGGTVRPARS